MKHEDAQVLPADEGRLEPSVRPQRCGLTRAELHQLLDYVQHCEGEGWYWGNKAQFRNRHDKLKAWLNAQIDIAIR